MSCYQIIMDRVHSLYITWNPSEHFHSLRSPKPFIKSRNRCAQVFDTSRGVIPSCSNRFSAMYQAAVCIPRRRLRLGRGTRCPGQSISSYLSGFWRYLSALPGCVIFTDEDEIVYHPKDCQVFLYHRRIVRRITVPDCIVSG